MFLNRNWNYTQRHKLLHMLCHSRLSGIFPACPCTVMARGLSEIVKKDAGQAGMTDLGRILYYAQFYKSSCIKNNKITLVLTMGIKNK